MKLVIASDIHGSAFWCEKLMDLVKQEDPDYLLLLGDILYHGPRTQRILFCMPVSIAMTCFGA